MTAGPGRALRVDAARNHERIVVAAARAFEEVGADVSLEEVARRAGVGVATLYRRFRTRDQLVRAVVQQVFTDEIEPATRQESGHPWRDLADALEGVTAAVAGHRVVLTAAREAGAVDVDDVDRYLRSLQRLLDRARGAGLVRPELTARDLAAVVVMVIATVRPADPQGADRRRYLALLLDGLRPSPTMLPAPASTTGCANPS